MKPTLASDNLRSFVERIERLEAEVKELNSDKSDVYAEAKGNGFDVKALKAVIAYRRKDAGEAREQQAIFETYLSALQSGTEPATRVRAHDSRSKPQESGDGIPDFLDRRASV